MSPAPPRAIGPGWDDAERGISVDNDRCGRRPRRLGILRLRRARVGGGRRSCSPTRRPSIHAACGGTYRIRWHGGGVRWHVWGAPRLQTSFPCRRRYGYGAGLGDRGTDGSPRHGKGGAWKGAWKGSISCCSCRTSQRKHALTSTYSFIRYLLISVKSAEEISAGFGSLASHRRMNRL